MLMPPRLEIATTKTFSVVYSATPLGSPHFAVTTNTGTVVASIPMSGTANSWFAFYTIPGTANVLYAYTITASFTAGPDVLRGLFLGHRTGAW